MRHLILAVALASTIVNPSLAQEAKDPAKKVAVYDVDADAKAQIERALEQAKLKRTRVLIQWGANWCGWCIKLDGTMKSAPELAAELRNEFEYVKINVGRFDINMDLAAKYGADLKGNGIPYLTVLSADGETLSNTETGSLEKDGGHDVSKVLAYLTTHRVERLNADTVMNAAKERAKLEHKKILLHFGAPWCSWCVKLKSWMNRPEIRDILIKDYIDVEIDTMRDENAGEIHRAYNIYVDKPSGGGIPWFAVVDHNGAKLSDSNSSKGNIGFPTAPEEIAHFMTMLRSTRSTITDKELATIEASLAAPQK